MNSLPVVAGGLSPQPPGGTRLAFGCGAAFPLSKRACAAATRRV